MSQHQKVPLSPVLIFDLVDDNVATLRVVKDFDKAAVFIDVKKEPVLDHGHEDDGLAAEHPDADEAKALDGWGIGQGVAVGVDDDQVQGDEQSHPSRHLQQELHSRHSLHHGKLT